MAKWICKVCGYTHEGDEAPDQCPQCGASKVQFYQEGNGSSGCAFSLLAIAVVTAAALLSFVGCNSSATVDNSAVNTLDISKFLGKWYEIARFDHKFERKLEHCIATYTMQDNGTIKVTNQGIKDGKWKTTTGKAKITDEPGVLRVSFFWPIYSDYRIMMLAPDYSYALVGGDNDEYLWILSRTPRLAKETCDKIVRNAQSRGYNTNNLIWVKQGE